MGMPIYPPRELERRPVPQRGMRTNPIVILPPGFCQPLGFVQRQEPVLIQALVTKPSIERLDHSIIRGLSRPAEVELHAVEGGSQIQAPRDELGPVIDSNALRLTAIGGDLLQDPYDVVPGQPLAHLDRQALTAVVID